MSPEQPEVINLGFNPRPLQAAEYRKLKRFNVLVAHRRFGKTVFCVMKLVDAAVFFDALEDGRFAYIAPYFNQAKDVAWGYLKRYMLQIPGAEANEAELRVDIPNPRGGVNRVRLYGADNADRLRGLYFDGVVVDEYAMMSPRVWSEIIRPTLVDRQGWAVFIGTPLGRNHFADLYEAAVKDPEDWHAARYKASETGIIDPVELEVARNAMTADQYAQEFEVSFDAAIPGAYYAQFLTTAEAQGRVRRMAWEPAIAVHTGWDLGIGDPTAIWFAQVVNGEVRLIDYYEASGVGLDHYIAQLRAGRRAEWIYGLHFFPHDVRVKELGTGMSRVDILKAHGLNPTVLAQSSVDDGISQARFLIRKAWFDPEACAQGLKALRQYRSEWDEKRQVLKPVPLHDWTSHASDAFRYLAIGLGRHTIDRVPLVDTGLSQSAREFGSRPRFATGAPGQGGSKPWGW
jgi:hypothetical protein